MRRTLFRSVALILAAIPASAGCGSNPPPEVTKAQEVTPVAPPAELVGTWRLEVKDDNTSRTSVYRFSKDGRIEVDTRVKTPDGEITDLVKRAITNVEKDRITVVDLSRTGRDGVEENLPATRRRTRTLQVRVQGDELHMTEIAQDGYSVPDATSTVLTRVAE